MKTRTYTVILTEAERAEVLHALARLEDKHARRYARAKTESRKQALKKKSAFTVSLWHKIKTAANHE